MIDNVRDAITYLLPGFVAYLLYRRAVPLREESDLTLAAKSMIWSLLINASITASTLIARGYHAIDWSSPVAILWQLLLAVLSGLGLGLLERKRHVLNACWRVFDVRMSKREDPWSEVLDLDSVGGGCAYVRTTDGFTYYGWVSQYTIGANLSYGRRCGEGVEGVG